VVGNDGSREVVSVDDGNNNSSSCDSAKAPGRHRRRSAAATLIEETVRKGLEVGSSCRRRVEGGRGVGGHGHPVRHRNNNTTTVAQRDEVIHRAIYVSDIDYFFILI
jgi:hypothetical protein